MERWRMMGGTVGISEWDIRADDALVTGEEGGVLEGTSPAAATQKLEEMGLVSADATPVLV